MANHRRPYKVSKNGIRIQLGKEAHWYRNEGTGSLIGRIVQVYFNPEDPSSIWVQKSINDSETLVVSKAPTPPAFDATREEMAEATESCAAHNRHALTTYKKIKSHFSKNGLSHFRRNMVSADFIEQTQDVQNQQARIRTGQKKKVQEKKKATHVRRMLGNQPGSDAVSTNRLLAAERLMREAKKDADT